MGPVIDIDPWDLVRVEDPADPGALATSATGATRVGPPAHGKWRVEPVPEPGVAPPEGGSVAWEAVEAMAVQPWHDAGITGKGVRIAVFDLQWADWDRAAHHPELGTLRTWDCFAHRSCEVPFDAPTPRFTFEAASHGVACAEVIRDIAPGAEVDLVRVNSFTTLENGVDWAIREGVDIISMSLSFYSDSFHDGTGAINDLMDRLAAAGVLMVTSAGNSAEEHWVGDLRDDDGDGVHEWSTGTEDLWVWMPAGDRRVTVMWDDFTNCGDTDLDVLVLDEAGVVRSRALARQVVGAEDCSPVERLSVRVAASAWHRLQVRRFGGDPVARVDVMVRGGEVWEGVPAGSLTDPATHPSVVAVGAVRARGYAFNGPESFSSRGPTNGGLAKPDIAGPNGLSGTVYGPTGFYGTSASTPAVVGAIALLMEEDPRLDAEAATERLKATALRDGAAGDAGDPGLGAGRARLLPPGSAPPCGGNAGWGLVLMGPLFALGARRRRSG